MADLGGLGLWWKYILDGMTVHGMHIMFWRGGRKPGNPEETMQFRIANLPIFGSGRKPDIPQETHTSTIQSTDINLRSGLSPGPWSTVPSK